GDNRAAARTQCQGADDFRHLPATRVAATGIHATNRPGVGINPVQPLLLDIPERPFAKPVGYAGYGFDLQHGQSQNATRSPPFNPSMSRASSGVAGDLPRPSMILHAKVTCSAFDFASRPLPAQRLSSRPPRMFPPSAAAWAATRNWLEPAPSTDQR